MVCCPNSENDVVIAATATVFDDPLIMDRVAGLLCTSALDQGLADLISLRWVCRDRERAPSPHREPPGGAGGVQ